MHTKKYTTTEIGLIKTNMNKYIEKYIKQIKNAVSDTDFENIINKIYEDGFQDGADNK